MSLTANTSFALEVQTPIKKDTGKTPDTSENLDFGFFDWVWYKDNAGVGDNMCGRWLGVSHRVGSLTSYWILTIAGRVISRATVQCITNLELGTNNAKEQCKDYNKRITALMNDDSHLMHDDGERQLQDWDEYTDVQDEACNNEFNSAVSGKKKNEADADFSPDVLDDTYLNKEIAKARGAGGSKNVQYGRVTRGSVTPMADRLARRMTIH